MNLPLIILLSASIASCAASVSLAPWIDIEDKGRSCCSLEWSNFTVGSVELLTNAITFNSTRGNVYAQADGVTLKFFNPKYADRLNGSTVTLLSNPHNCTMRMSSQSNAMSSKSDFYVPAMNGMSVTQAQQSRVSYRESDTTDTIAEYFSLWGKGIKSHDLCEYSNREYSCSVIERSILQIDCMDSMKNVLHPQLKSFVIDESTLRDRAVEVKYARQEMINRSNFTVDDTYESEMNLPISLHIDLEANAFPFLEYLEDKTYLDRALDNETESHLSPLLRSPDFQPLLQNIHRRAVNNSHAASTYLLKVVTPLEICPQRKCTLVSSLVKYKVTQPVTVKLAIVPRPLGEKYWTAKKVLSSFIASGVDTNGLSEEDGSLVFSYNGTATVRGFISDDPDYGCEHIATK